jgi:phosphate transport system substrate-binding protein
MIKTLAIAMSATVAMGAFAHAASISGAGATAPAPIYQKWAEAYRAKTGVGLNYQGIGSGGGIKQIEAKTVDFGASDKPLAPADLNSHGLMQFPTVIVGIAPVVNIPGVNAGQLHLTGQVLADIYLGEIRRWSDPRIANLNKGVRLPNLPITVVHRSDGSGTTFLYTSYLKIVSPAWGSKVGASDSVQWPTGQGGKGNDGVAAFVKQTPGSIGYVEYAYAKNNNLAYVDMADKSGAFIAPNEQTFTAAAAHAEWNAAEGFAPVLLDQPGANAWPIAGATFILIYKNPGNAAATANVLKFFDWAYANGDAMANQLAYVPLPGNVKSMIRQAWSSEVKSGGKAVYAH